MRRSESAIWAHRDINAVDPHLQYLRVDGYRPMEGDLNMDGYDILNVGLINGTVDIENHASRHQSGGADPLDGYDLTLNYSPMSYVVTNDVIGAHIAAIDNALAGGGGGTGPSLLQPFSYTVTNTNDINVFQNGNVWFTYFIVDHNITITQMQVHVAQGASGTVWTGIYNSNGSILLAEDSTGVSTSTTGIKTLTLDSSVSLIAGTGYYLAVTTSGNGTLFTGLSVSSSNVSPIRSGIVSSGNNPSTGLPSTITIGNSQLTAVWLSILI